jgi:hypothetical protein
MTRLPDRFIEDRNLRDAARAVLTDDIEQLRASLAEQGIASRVSSGFTSTISGRLKDGARDVWAEAKAHAGDNRGVLAVVIGAIVLWFARSTIFEWIEELIEESSYDDEDEITGAATPDAAPEGDPQ